MDQTQYICFAPRFCIFTYINGEYVEAVWDEKRRAWVFPE